MKHPPARRSKPKVSRPAKWEDPPALSSALVPVGLPALVLDDEDSGEVVGELVQLLRAGVVDAYEAHLAPDTVLTYAEGWKDFLAFAEELRRQGADAPVLPAHPGDTAHLGTLAMWLVWCCEHRQVVYVRRDGTKHIRQTGLAWSTVETRLAGVVKALAERGVPDPRNVETFRRVVRGLKRNYSRPPVRVTALTVPLLREVLDASYARPPMALRDRALVCLVHGGVSATRLAKLDWDDLAVTDDAWHFVRRGHEPVRLVPRPELPELDPIDALLTWRREGLGGMRNGPVFPALDGQGRMASTPDGVIRRSSKQALIWRVKGLAVAAGLAVPDSASLPDLSDPAVAGRAAAACDAHRPIDLRDRAVLTVGLALASRRRNLAEFVIADLTLSDPGLVMDFSRSKTDPYGTDHRRVDLRRVGGPYCPVSLLEAWLERYRELLGRDLAGTDPVFVRLDRGHPVLDSDGRPIALARPAVSEIVRTRAAAAGKVGRFRSHSLRRGFATTLARRKVPIQEIARRGGWKTLEVVQGYIEESELFETSVSALLGLTAEDDAG